MFEPEEYLILDISNKKSQRKYNKLDIFYRGQPFECKQPLGMAFKIYYIGLQRAGRTILNRQYILQSEN